MNAERFPYAKAMTATWMTAETLGILPLGKSTWEISWDSVDFFVGHCRRFFKQIQGDAHAHDHSSVTLALHCRTFAVPKHG